MIHDRWIMFIIMIISGLLSTMNLWVDKLSDIRWSFNDIYMALWMSGWMFLLMGFYYQDTFNILIGFFQLLVSFIAIRIQLFIGIKQYLYGMIPHHSMAVFMTKNLLLKSEILPKPLTDLTKTIIETQEKEIQIFKNP